MRCRKHPLPSHENSTAKNKSQPAKNALSISPLRSMRTVRYSKHHLSAYESALPRPQKIPARDQCAAKSTPSNRRKMRCRTNPLPACEQCSAKHTPAHRAEKRLLKAPPLLACEQCAAKNKNFSLRKVRCPRHTLPARERCSAKGTPSQCAKSALPNTLPAREKFAAKQTPPAREN